MQHHSKKIKGDTAFTDILDRWQVGTEMRPMETNLHNVEKEGENGWRRRQQNGDRSEPLRALLQVPDSQILTQPEAPVAARGVASMDEIGVLQTIVTCHNFNPIKFKSDNLT